MPLGDVTHMPWEQRYWQPGGAGGDGDGGDGGVCWATAAMALVLTVS